MNHVRLALVCTALIGAGTATARDKDSEILVRMLGGRSAMEGAKLEKAIAKADSYDLGSSKNPVRVAMPTGERAYLARLRCADGSPPAYDRAGSAGVGVFGNIIDIYELKCAAGEPAQAEVSMDMYHPEHRENRPVPGFTIDE